MAKYSVLAFRLALIVTIVPYFQCITARNVPVRSQITTNPLEITQASDEKLRLRLTSSNVHRIKDDIHTSDVQKARR